MEDIGGAVKKDKIVDSSGNEEFADVVLPKVGDKRPYCEDDDMKPASLGKQDLNSTNNKVSVKSDTGRREPGQYSMASFSSRKDQEDQLESAKAEMGEVSKENRRLKMHLNKIMNDYQKLQMQLYDIVGKDSKKSQQQEQVEIEEEPDQLVSLTLGRFSSDSKRDIDKNRASRSHGKEDDIRGNEGLSLGLDYKFEASNKSEIDDEPLPNPSPVNSTSQEPKEEETWPPSPVNSTSQEPKEEETWPPSKVLKTTARSGADDEVLQQNPVKKARVCVRTRCDTPTMNDGCKWRKYGQKIAKGNPCPRAYYRCTVATSCPVRKQVQRCAEDMSILITTYEGAHNHPLPMSATAMASTTCAAASMLLSGSSSSSNPNVPSSNSYPSLHGLNIYLSDHNSKSKFYLPNSSLSTASAHPTITLDLTSAPSSSTTSFPFNRFSPSAYNPTSSRYNNNNNNNNYTTSLSFGSSESNTMSWANGLFSNAGITPQPYMENPLNINGRVLPQSTMENSSIYQLFMQKNSLINHHPQTLPDSTIAAATKAITTDPNFQSAFAVALQSIIGCGSSGQTSGGKGNIGCGSSFFNKSTSTTSQQPGSSMFLLPPNSLPYSTPKSASTSPGDTGNHSN